MGGFGPEPGISGMGISTDFKFMSRFQFGG
jgi:hypothetical protein